MSNPALHPDRREITTYPAMTADWSVRTLVPCVLVAARLTDDAADLAQLPEITPVSFQWPGLLERASRIVTGAGAVLLEMFLPSTRGAQVLCHRPIRCCGKAWARKYLNERMMVV